MDPSRESSDIAARRLISPKSAALPCDFAPVDLYTATVDRGRRGRRKSVVSYGAGHVDLVNRIDAVKEALDGFAHYSDPLR
jgi:hypothetical protein